MLQAQFLLPITMGTFATNAEVRTGFLQHIRAIDTHVMTGSLVIMTRFFITLVKTAKLPTTSVSRIAPYYSAPMFALSRNIAPLTKVQVAEEIGSVTGSDFVSAVRDTTFVHHTKIRLRTTQIKAVFKYIFRLITAFTSTFAF